MSCTGCTKGDWRSVYKVFPEVAPAACRHPHLAGLSLPWFTPLGAMEGRGSSTAQFSALTHAYLLPENGVPEEQGQKTGGEVSWQEVRSMSGFHARNRASGFTKGLLLFKPQRCSLSGLDRPVPEPLHQLSLRILTLWAPPGGNTLARNRSKQQTKTSKKKNHPKTKTKLHNCCTTFSFLKEMYCNSSEFLNFPNLRIWFTNRDIFPKIKLDAFLKATCSRFMLWCIPLLFWTFSGELISGSVVSWKPRRKTVLFSSLGWGSEL